MARRGSPSTRVGEAATRFQGAGAASCSVELTTGLRFLRLGMVFAGRVKRYPIGLTFETPLFSGRVIRFRGSWLRQQMVARVPALVPALCCRPGG